MNKCQLTALIIPQWSAINNALDVVQVLVENCSDCRAALLRLGDLPPVAGELARSESSIALPLPENKGESTAGLSSMGGDEGKESKNALSLSATHDELVDTIPHPLFNNPRILTRQSSLNQVSEMGYYISITYSTVFLLEL